MYDHTPQEIAELNVNIGVKKTLMPIYKMILLSILAGAYIAFAAEGSTLAMHDIPSIGLGRFIAGIIFSTGLMLVVICGAELFTGNTLLGIAWLEHKITLRELFRNWFWVYIGNFIGSILLAVLMDLSALWDYNNALHGIYALKIALGKVNLSFSAALVRGILCNWLVCLAVWMAYSAKDTAGKILAIFFPIMLFITSAFEHCVANMYYLTAGLLLKRYLSVASAFSPAELEQLTLQTMLFHNLLPVTLGNIIGGAIFVGGFYWYSYLKK